MPAYPYSRASGFLQGQHPKYRDGGVVHQSVKGGADKIRMPALTISGPCLAQRPEHTSVAMDLKVVLRQACVSASKRLDFGPALPYTMRTVARLGTVPAPTASASGLTVACFI